MTRTAIAGGPRTGKTTLARKLALATERDPRHTDSLVETHDWSAASAEVARWFDEPGPWVIEGTTVSRALRKWREQHPGSPPPVDRVVYLTEPHVPLTDGQARLAAGVDTIHRQVAGWLTEHGVADPLD